MSRFLAESWPMLGALALVGLITFGALRATISADRKRRRNQEQDDNE